MLFVLTGSSGSGKSTVAHVLQATGLEHHDSDEDGVPSGADTRWRQGALEHFVQRALALEGRSDLLLTGQSPLGEVFAAPSAPLLDGIAVALLDVADTERLDRLRARQPGQFSDQQLRGFIGWARWHRGHAADPGWIPEAITSGSGPEMRWERWRRWARTDPRWCTEVVDTSGRSVADSAADIADWITRVRAAPRWPLRRGWHRDGR